MIIEKIISQTIGPNTKMTGLRYWRPENPKNLVLFYHGVGEEGPPDGSQLAELEILQGFPKFAKGKRPWGSTVTGSVEYDFDIIAVQVQKKSNFAESYDFLIPFILPFLNSHYGYENIIIGGISMGNYGAWRTIINPPGREFLKGIIAICGSCPTGDVTINGQKMATIPNQVKLPGIAWHGTADPTVGYSGHKGFVDKYNEAGGRIEFNALPNVNHAAWSHAFNSNPAKDRTLQKVYEIFEHEALKRYVADLTVERDCLKKKVTDAETHIDEILDILPK